MKKLIPIILYIIMSISLCVGVSAGALTKMYYPDGTHRLVGQSLVKLETKNGASLKPSSYVTMHAIDGRTLQVKKSEIKLYENVGWYLGPVTKMFSADGRFITVKNDEIELYGSLGWYLDPVTVMYALDGRTLVVKKTEIELYESVGWYIEPVMTVYAEDGRTLIIPKRELEAYLNVGWYKSRADFPLRDVPMVALTFDDGPSKFTPRILDSLEKHGAKATFFVIGRSARANPAIVKRAYDLGMEIGNHTMNHPDLKKLSASGIKNELSKAENAVVSATGAAPTLIRPPYGNYNKTVSSVANAPLILWSIDTLDWKTRDADKTVDTVLKEVKDGSIILMHDLYESSADAAARLIPELISRGYRLVTVSEMAEAKGYSLNNGTAYRSFYGK